MLRSAPAVGSKRKVGRPKTSAKCAKCSKNWKGAFCATCPGWSAAAEAAEAAQADEAAAVATTGAAAAMTTVATSSATTGSASDLAPSAPGSTPRLAHARPRAQCCNPSRVTGLGSTCMDIRRLLFCYRRRCSHCGRMRIATRPSSSMARDISTVVHCVTCTACTVQLMLIVLYTRLGMACIPVQL